MPERFNTNLDVRGRIRTVTRIGLGVNLILSALKGVLGIMAGSQACVADAVHSLSDCMTDVAVLVGVEFWMAPADATHPHGHRRIEAMVTLFIALILAIAALGLGYRALTTLGAHHQTPPGWAAFAAALLSMVTKESLYRWTAYEGARLHASSLVANAWHQRSDALSSIPVAAAVLISRIWPALTHADHIAAILVTAMLLHAAWKIAMPSVHELTDRGADSTARKAMIELAAAIPGVKEVHALRSRRIGPGYAVDLHVLVDPEMSVKLGHAVCDQVRNALLESELRVFDVLVHLEPYEEDSRSSS